MDKKIILLSRRAKNPFLQVRDEGSLAFFVPVAIQSPAKSALGLDGLGCKTLEALALSGYAPRCCESKKPSTSGEGVIKKVCHVFASQCSR